MFQILVVEDDRSTARLMRTALQHAGYEVHAAGNGREALEVMEHQHIDLVLLDVMMPVMDGYEFAKTLRAGGDTTPLLMVTAKGEPADRCRGWTAACRAGRTPFWARSVPARRA